jgi:Flp pilus assembly protein TadD
MPRIGRALALLALVAGPSGPARAQAGTEAELSFEMGLTHLREGRAEQALEQFRKAIKQDSKNPYFFKGLGQAQLRLRRFEEAEKSFLKALELNPYFTDIHNDLGTALAGQGKREAARKEFLAAYSDPTNPTPELTARNLANAYFEERNYPDALNWARTAVARNRSYGEAHILVADVLAAMGRLEEAVLHLEEAEKACPDNLGVTLALGHAYYQAGRFGDAKARLEGVARKDPAGPLGRRAVELLKNITAK